MFSLGADERAGLISGRIPIGPTASVQVFERVLLEPTGRPTVERYSYYLIVAGIGEVRGFDHDPTHDPATHVHDSQHRRSPSERVSLKEAMTVFWKVSADLSGTGEVKSDG